MSNMLYITLFSLCTVRISSQIAPEEYGNHKQLYTALKGILSIAITLEARYIYMHTLLRDRDINDIKIHKYRGTCHPEMVHSDYKKKPNAILHECPFVRGPYI